MQNDFYCARENDGYSSCETVCTDCMRDHRNIKDKMNDPDWKFRNSIAMQIKFHLHSGLSFADTVDHIFKNAAEFCFAKQKEFLDILSIKYDGKYFTHPMTNTYEQPGPVIKELYNQLLTLKINEQMQTKKQFEIGSQQEGGGPGNVDGGKQPAERENSQKGRDQVDETRRKLHPVDSDEVKPDEGEILRGFRVRIDSLYLTAKELSNRPYLTSRELSLAVTSFQSARQNAGKLLEVRTKGKSPYGKDYVKRQDAGQVIEGLTPPITNKEEATAVLVPFRDLTETIIQEFNEYADEKDTAINSIDCAAEISVLQGLINGKMWLGEIFAILKEPTSN